MEENKPRQIMVFGEKDFKITIPHDAKLTFGPWSPPPKNSREGWAHGDKVGTLRVYKGTKDNILACFSGVHGFRDVSLDFIEKVAVETGDTIWKSDQSGYMRESKQSSTQQWVRPQLPGIEDVEVKKPKNGNGKKK
jgi:hypothetical protein